VLCSKQFTVIAVECGGPLTTPHHTPSLRMIRLQQVNLVELLL
jgi:hypothetical protein